MGKAISATTSDLVFSVMSEMPNVKMTVDEFLVWAGNRPGRHELVDGRVHAMAPERVAHGRVKQAALLALAQAIATKGLACEALPDGMTVRIDQSTAYEPDALVYCGPRLPGDAIEVPHPVIVIEVLSPGTRGYDKGGKIVGYFMVPSIRHYLIIDPDRCVVIHHRREGDAIVTHIARTGVLALDPPGIGLDLDDMLSDKQDFEG